MPSSADLAAVPPASEHPQSNSAHSNPAHSNLAPSNGAALSVRFSETVRAISTELRAAGLETPVFRSPPRLPGRDRTLRRRRRGAVVSVRLAGRPFAAVQADLIDGACVANALDTDAAEDLRARLWASLARVGQVDDGGPAELRAA